MKKIKSLIVPNRVERLVYRIFDLNRNTRISRKVPLIGESCLKIQEMDIEGVDSGVAKYLLDQFMHHRFDLLGSGWVENSYDSRPFGIEGIKYDHNLAIESIDKDGNWLSRVVRPQHLKACKKIWQQVSAGYKPIDWQKDFKSGYRWNAMKWYKDQRKKYFPGADLKVPWELARFQHLPQMAVFSVVLPSQRPKVIREFKNQVLDFIAANPPRMGVNWTTTMDVGIRATNLLIAYDLFTQLDNTDILDKDFKQIFAISIYEHGIHIVKNLEFKQKLTSNHYLSNIGGLLLISLYLTGNKDVNAWLAFSVQELLNETRKQFYEDGGNFESSTSYHRLSGEIVTYATAFILGINPSKINSLTSDNSWVRSNKLDVRPYTAQAYSIKNNKIILPDWFINRLYKMAGFTSDLTKPNGNIVQFGDNDSGRFIKLSPTGSLIHINEAKKKYLNLANYITSDHNYWDENYLDHSSFLAAIEGLFTGDGFSNSQASCSLEHSFIRSVTKKQLLKPTEIVESHLKIKNCAFSLENYPYFSETKIRTKQESEISLKKGLTKKYYDRTGIVIIKSDRLYLAVSMLSNGQNGNGGHGHNDILSFELSIDNKDIVIDPGTYVYTSIPDKRNLFRSTRVHNTIIVESEEQNSWNEGIKGLFKRQEESSCELVELTNNRLIISLKYRNISQLRIFTILDNKLIIKDYSNCLFHSNLNKFNIYSNGYGKLVKFR